MRMTLAAAAAALFLFPAAAGAQTYPEPQGAREDRAQAQGAVQDPHGLQEEEKCDFRTIQKAVNAAKAGDKITVRPAPTARRSRSAASKKRYLRIVGDPKQARPGAPRRAQQEAERLLRQRRRPGHDQRLHGP